MFSLHKDKFLSHPFHCRIITLTNTYEDEIINIILYVETNIGI